MYINKLNETWILWVLEEVRLRLNLTGAQLELLVQEYDLFKFLSEDYEYSHCFGVEEGVTRISRDLLQRDDGCGANEIKLDSGYIWEITVLLEIMSLHLGKSPEDCYLLFIISEQYSDIWIPDKSPDYNLSARAWADRIYGEKGLKVEW